jgi:hypothetical protein
MAADPANWLGRRTFIFQPGDDFRPYIGIGLAPDQDSEMLQAHPKFSRVFYHPRKLCRNRVNERFDRDKWGDFVGDIDHSKYRD